MSVHLTVPRLCLDGSLAAPSLLHMSGLKPVSCAAGRWKVGAWRVEREGRQRRYEAFERLVCKAGGEGKGSGVEEGEAGCRNVAVAEDRVDGLLQQEGEKLALWHSVEEEEMEVVKKEEEVGGEDSSAAVGGTLVGIVLLAGVLGGFGVLGFLYKEQINVALLQFSDVLEGYGVAGYGLFVLGYAGLEVLAVPAFPLTMSAGLLFGSVTGTILVSVAGTIAATVSFLIARYLIRDRILELAKDNKKFLAIDRAIGRDGFRIVTILRLSPLLPFALGNYLYGLTSVRTVPYVLGSWLGMLPGTWAYVSAGAIGKALIQQESQELLPEGPEKAWILGLGILATFGAAGYVNRLAKDALKELDE